MASSHRDDAKSMNVTTYLVWISIVLGVLAISCGYVGWRLIVTLKLAMPWRLYAWIPLGLMFVLPFGSS